MATFAFAFASVSLMELAPRLTLASVPGRDVLVGILWVAAPIVVVALIWIAARFLARRPPRVETPAAPPPGDVFEEFADLVANGDMDGAGIVAERVLGLRHSSGTHPADR